MPSSNTLPAVARRDQQVPVPKAHQNTENLLYLEKGIGKVHDKIEYPLVAPGEYEARYKDHRTFRQYGGGEKLRAFFVIEDQGPAFAVAVPRFWNVSLTKRGFTVGKRSAFLREFCRLFPEYRPTRSDRIPMDYFRGKAFRIRVQTVVKDRNRKPIPEQVQYSKVAEIMGVLC
jgi:hypothetical protein